MSAPQIESRSFSWAEPGARAFFVKHGYVVIDEVLRDHELSSADRAWQDVVRDGAAVAGLSPDAFVERFPQNRDLWRKHDAFRDLLFDSAQSQVVRSFLGTTGARLFHDQAICKPAGRSSTIPWHQDSAYWPLDRVGLSVWTPTASVPANGGCLKVLDGSHHDGPGAPQDFLAGGGAGHDTDPRLTFLPVRRGQSVLLDGLTWHGSDPNTAERDRLAYLTLWVPASSRFVPEHASWHPSSAHIRVAPGERLEGDYFPLFGDIDQEEERVAGTGRGVVFPVPPKDGGPSMFTASKDVAAQLAWVTGVRGTAPSLSELLATEAQRTALARRLIDLGLLAGADQEETVALLDDLRRQEVVRRLVVARDVYLRTVSRWWALVGTEIEARRRLEK